MNKLLAALGLCLCIPVAYAQMGQEKLSPMGEKIEAAMKSDIRTAEEKGRDEERRPRETLEFFGLKDNMRVVELVPAGGWFTKILAQVLAEKGELYVALGTRQIEPLIRQYPALSKVKIAQGDGKLVPTARMGLFDLGEFSLGVTDADLVLTFRNVHNFTPAGRQNLHKAVFKAVKPGGYYGILDHTRRHNEPDNPENWRRVDPVQVIKEVQAAGFVFVDYSGLHFHPDDELRFEVGRKTVTGNTDRTTLLFRKPGK